MDKKRDNLMDIVTTSFSLLGRRGIEGSILSLGAGECIHFSQGRVYLGCTLRGP